jgi:hypothetical protein
MMTSLEDGFPNAGKRGPGHYQECMNHAALVILWRGKRRTSYCSLNLPRASLMRGGRPGKNGTHHCPFLYHTHRVQCDLDIQLALLLPCAGALTL